MHSYPLPVPRYEDTPLPRIDLRLERVVAAGGEEMIQEPSLLALDSSYTFETTKRLHLWQAVLVRDLDGFFRHVWSVHPFGELSEASQGRGSGTLERHQLNDRHTFIQARPGRFAALRLLFPLNFVLAQIGLFCRLRTLIRNERVSVIRAGDPLYTGLLGLLLARNTRIPLVIRINANNDSVRETTGRPMYPRLLRSIAVEKALERFVLRRADWVVAPSQDYMDFAVANGADPQRTALFRYGNLLAPQHLIEPAKRGFDESLFKSLGIEPRRYLLCVSRLQQLKFPDDAVRCLRSARSAGHDVRLVLAGDGPMRNEIEALIRQLDLADHVALPGSLPQNALEQLYPNAAVVVSPLTGRALSEAAFGGAAIAAYHLDWQSDLIETGVTGELVPFRDNEALGKAVLKFLDQPQYARDMGKAVRARALDMLHPERLNAHERAVYARLLGIDASYSAAAHSLPFSV